jgi:hypothetical protein
MVNNTFLCLHQPIPSFWSLGGLSIIPVNVLYQPQKSVRKNGES